MKVNFFAILVYVASASSALLSIADVLPKSWLPFIVVIATLTHAFTPRAAKRGARTSPPQTGRAQSGRVSLAALLAMLALCSSLPFVLTGCPQQKPGETREQFAERIARDGTKRLDRASGEIAAIRLAVRDLREGDLLDADAAREFETGLRDANTALGAATREALTYQSVADFAGEGLNDHLQKACDVLEDLHDHGALRIKNPQHRAEFKVLLTAARIGLRTLQGELDAPPDGTDTLPQSPLDAELRRTLERARDQFDANDKSFSEDLAPAAAPEGAPLA